MRNFQMWSKRQLSVLVLRFINVVIVDFTIFCNVSKNHFSNLFMMIFFINIVFFYEKKEFLRQIQISCPIILLHNVVDLEHFKLWIPFNFEISDVCFQDENMLQDLYISVEDEFGIPTDIWRYKETSEQVQIISNQNLEILTTFFSRNGN